MIARALGALLKPRTSIVIAQPAAAALPTIAPVAIAAEAVAVVALPVVILAGDERPMIAAIGAHATAAAGMGLRHEPEDFRLASRLRSVAKLNRPTAVASIATTPRVSILAGRTDGVGRSSAVKRLRPGLLPPLACRGSTPAALAA
jgi:hypothetical protein